MKAPEKIYLTEDNPLKEWYRAKQVGFDSIEYTRTDAFIDKACEYWYQYNRDIVKKHGAKAVLGCSEFTVNIEDFKKYMEDKL